MSRGDTESSYVSCDVLRTMLSQTTCIESIWHLDESKRIALKRSFTCPRYECVSLVQNIASHFRLGADTRDLANDFATKYLWKSEDAACECLELVAATSVVVAAKLLEHSPEVGIVSHACAPLRDAGIECFLLVFMFAEELQTIRQDSDAVIRVRVHPGHRSGRHETTQHPLHIRALACASGPLSEWSRSVRRGRERCDRRIPAR